MCVNAGMWFERFIIIVGGLHRDFLPSSWGMFYPTWVDIWTFIGTFGIFLSLFLLFIRFLPMIAMSEVKIVLPEADPHHHRPTDIIRSPPAERSAHENAFRKQGLRNGGGISDCGRALSMPPKRVRDAGFKRWDVHSPFPIHGMDDAMGLGKSWLSAVVLDRRHHRIAHGGAPRRSDLPGSSIRWSCMESRSTGARFRHFSRSCSS